MQEPAAGATSQTSNSGAMTDASGNTVQPEVDPASLKSVDFASMKTDDLKGVDVIGPQGQKLGAINDFVLGKGTDKVDAVIVDFGGFLGIGTASPSTLLDVAGTSRSQGMSTLSFNTSSINGIPFGAQALGVQTLAF